MKLSMWRARTKKDASRRIVEQPLTKTFNASLKVISAFCVDGILDSGSSHLTTA
nr:hypothetical protein [uncultured Methanoregula sp.]